MIKNIEKMTIEEIKIEMKELRLQTQFPDTIYGMTKDELMEAAYIIAWKFDSLEGFKLAASKWSEAYKDGYNEALLVTEDILDEYKKRGNY